MIVSTNLQWFAFGIVPPYAKPQAEASALPQAPMQGFRVKFSTLFMVNYPKVLVVATSRKTRGGITSVVKAHETGAQWKKYHCRWVETHRDGNALRKLWYLLTALVEYVCLLPFYDIVHIHVGLRTSVGRKLVFAKIARAFGKKIIVHFHPATEKHLFDEHKYKIEELFSYADLLLVLAPQWIRWINQAFPNRHFRMRVLYNPCPNVNRDFSRKKKNILFAGTLSERKGYNRLLEAFAKIAPKHKDWKLVFAGNGQLEEAKELQRRLGIPASQVEYLGWVSGKDKEAAFQEASIYCLPSWGEGFPMGVLDAWAYGVPVVTTPVGGITDIIANGENGIVYDIYDIEGLAASLSRLMDSQELRKRIVQQADSFVNGEFNVKNIASQLDDIYSTL